MITLPVFPMTYYHPIHGGVTVKDAEEAAKVFTVPHDWFPTPEEADAHRHEGEAVQVIHNARRAQLTRHQELHPGVVMHSVTHQETVDRHFDQVRVAQEAEGAEPMPKTDEQGAELTS